MIRLTDGTRTIEVKVERKLDGAYMEDFAEEYFEDYGLELDAGKHAYIVESVEWAIDEAYAASCSADFVFVKEVLAKNEAPEPDADSEEGCCEITSSDSSPNAEADPFAEAQERLQSRGQEATERYLKINDYVILERNWKCKYGTVDFVAKDKYETLCFVEVKTRTGIDSGIPDEFVTPEKQRRYEKIAMSYLVESNYGDDICIRFDSIGICVSDEGDRALLRHHKGCFDPLV